MLLCSEPAEVLRRLKAKNAEIARAEAIARAPAEPAAVSPAGVRRWLATVGPAADDLMALRRLQQGADPPWTVLVAEIRERGDPVSRGALALDGHDLLGLGVPPDTHRNALRVGFTWQLPLYGSSIARTEPPLSGPGD